MMQKQPNADPMGRCNSTMRQHHATMRRASVGPHPHSPIHGLTIRFHTGQRTERASVALQHRSPFQNPMPFPLWISHCQNDPASTFNIPRSKSAKTISVIHKVPKSDVRGEGCAVDMRSGEDYTRRAAPRVCACEGGLGQNARLGPPHPNSFLTLNSSQASA